MLDGSLRPTHVLRQATYLFTFVNAFIKFNVLWTRPGEVLLEWSKNNERVLKDSFHLDLWHEIVLHSESLINDSENKNC